MGFWKKFNENRLKIRQKRADSEEKKKQET